MSTDYGEEELFGTMENEESEITEYEVERLYRIKRNRDMLANLHVEEIATALEPVPKKPREQSKKGKEKVDYVFPRRATRLSTRTKTPTKIVDWSSGESDSEAPSESDSDVAVLSKGPDKKKKIKKKKNASSPDELFEDEVSKKKQVDEEYEPSGASESDQDEEEADERVEDRHLQLSEKKQKSRNCRSSGKRAEFGKYSFRLKPLTSPTLSAKEEDTDCHDPDLEKAIQLSLKLDEPREDLRLKSPGAKGAGGSKPRKRKGGRDLKFTQSEADAYFVTIAGSGMGAISPKLLENAALAHDFIWSQEELQDMIDVFDENDDGFLSLPEFRAMAARCKLMEAS